MKAQMIWDRGRFIARQTEINDEFARLTPGEDELIAFFSRLAMETHDILVAQGVRAIFGFSTWPESAGFFLRPGNRFYEVPLSILEQWQQWERGYPEVEARNPRLELRNLMQTMSEMMGGMSWPQYSEWEIERWVAGGDVDANPYYRDYQIYARLQVLHSRLDGWVYQDDEGYIHFAELEEFKAIGHRQDEARREALQRAAAARAATRAQLEEHRRRGGVVIRTSPIRAEHPADAALITSATKKPDQAKD
jgi:hypothetical protein